MHVKCIFIISLSLWVRQEKPWILFTLFVAVTFHDVVVAAVFCNYKGNTPTTINIETVHKLNTRLRRTHKKAKQPDDTRQQQQQRGATTTAERQSNRRRGNTIGNNNVNKPEIQISINFPSLRTHARRRTHTRGGHTYTHTHVPILAYVAFHLFYFKFLSIMFEIRLQHDLPFICVVCSLCFWFLYAICCWTCFVPLFFIFFVRLHEMMII